MAVLYGAPPHGAQVETVKTIDGVELRAAFWQCEGPCRGAMLLAQGRTEYIEKAYPWIAAFRRRGLHVAAFDFRGQGLSQRLLPNRRKGFVSDFGLFQHDCDAVFDVFQQRAGGVPLLVCGHSMGGLATARFVERRQDKLRGAILSAPMLGFGLGKATILAARHLSCVMTRFGYGNRYVSGCDDRSGPERGFEDNVLTYDVDRFAAHSAMLDAHPDLVLGGVTHAWFHAGCREVAAMAALPRDWLKIPMLIASAADDTVVSNEAIADFVARQSLAQRVHLNHARHEPFMETDAVQAILWAAIDVFLDDLCGAQVTPPNI